MTSSGCCIELALAVAARDVAVAAEPEIAVVVGVGLMWALVLAPVELDGDAAVRPQAVDGPGAEAVRCAAAARSRGGSATGGSAGFQLALHVAVTGRVFGQRGAEVALRGARGAASG